MPVKTITIDMEAYNLLESEKRKGESFSKVIKRRLAPGKTAAALLRALPSCVLPPEALDRADALVRRRPESMTASAAIDVED